MGKLVYWALIRNVPIDRPVWARALQLHAQAQIVSTRLLDYLEASLKLQHNGVGFDN